MSQTPIELKGSSFTLSVVHLHQAQPEVIRQALQEKIAQAPQFLKNAPVVLNVAGLEGPVNWKQLQQAVLATGLRIIGVSGCKDETLKRTLTRAGIPVLTEGKEGKKREEPKAPVEPEKPVVLAEPAINKTRVINTPVRSGQQIYARNADLIVTSHVSAGAELVADGNIHVYGMMRGRALAGASGDRACQIFCTNLSAELVSIAGEYWISDQIPAEFYTKAARLSLKDGELAIQTLS
ncbi:MULTISPECIES: septum site-determining protein MinC [Pantoea]|uniref:Probable septum site-determining protein MinC n=1 Tax=Candidatus Pantoea multigeneris TaxID=2608357 RepID=A0ABX0RCL7_9GAMM|nr:MULTISPECIES: septum site-determining protein MinC [Pantoea]NIF21873.1 septum site-determining protein MinC [Pantoea multigeneris]